MAREKKREAANKSTAADLDIHQGIKREIVILAHVKHFVSKITWLRRSWLIKE